MRHRWSISSNGGTDWTEVTPANGSKITIAERRDLSSGQVFFRKQLAPAIVLQGADYRLLRPHLISAPARCADLLVRLEELCGVWEEAYRGKFSAGSCAWDLDACTVTIKPETVDRYTCLLEKSKEKFNLLQAARVDASIPVIVSDLEVYGCVACDGFDVCQPPGNALDPEWAWQEIAGAYPITIGTAPNECGCLLRTWGRVKTTTECVGGNPVPPQGSGWVLLSNDCATTGMATYVRELTGDEIFLINATVTEATCVDGVMVPPDCPAYLPLLPCGTTASSVDCVDEEVAAFWVCFGSSGLSVDDGRTFRSAIEYLLDRSGCDLQGVRSDFFEWDAVGDADGYSPGINYVTGTANDYAHLLLLQKSDAIDPSASNPATIGEATFEEVMTMLRVALRCLWDIDDDGYLRIEHWSYWQQAVGLDLETEDGVNEPLNWESLSSQAPRVERGVWMEAQGRDFVGKDISYSGPCVGNESKDWSPGRFTTDIAFVINNTEDISKDGFVLLATQLASGVYNVIIGNGALTGNFLSNAPLCWANLERDLWQHDRYLPTGNMNGADTVFSDFLPTIQQGDVTLPRCCRLSAFDARDRVTGSLARELDVEGIVEQWEYEVATSRMKLKIQYPF